MQGGISTFEAKALLKQHGYNELPSAKPKNIWKIALEVIIEPMFLLLLACGSIYVLLGDYTEGLILLCWVFIIIFITFYQHRKTEASLEALRKLSSPRALVLRDGIQIRIAGREVVPGDILLLNEGDRVPADAIILESSYLTMDESLLTGESIPVLKQSTNENSNNINLIFSGTLVIKGKAKAKVLSTGTTTQFGKIGLTLQSISSDKTRLQEEMKTVIRNLFFISGFISLGIFLSYYFTTGGFLQSLLNSLAAAMALLPEEFPVVLTIFVTIGAWRLSKINVLNRKPSAIETLGSATVLCSDKTGTITQNKMEIASLYTNGIVYSRHDFALNKKHITDLVDVLYHASASESIDPMEKAIITEFETLELPIKNLTLIKEYPLSNDLFVMTRIFQSPTLKDNIAYCKGSPEAIFSLCHLPKIETLNLTTIVHELAKKGLRVIGAAKCELKKEKLPKEQNEFDFQFVGLVAFEDPIRPEVPNAIKECNQAGIKVIMITGDYPETAKSIASKIGMQNIEHVLTGADLEKLGIQELKDKIKHTHIFARIIPEQKLHIIQALKANNEIVAMTGDGVNDAPAIKAADIGIAMGLRGTDVAREASSLVLLDDNFASIVKAIRSGRKIFDNLQKAMTYIIAIHIPIIGLVLIPSFFPSLPLILMPLHIVFLELIIDPICAFAFESEQEENNIMQRPPRDSEKSFFGWRHILFSILKGLFLLAIVLTVYFTAIHEGHTNEEVRAISFSALIVGNLFLILTSLSNTRSFIAVFKEKNYSVLFISFLTLIILSLTLSIPFLQNIFNFQLPGLRHFIPSFLGAFSLLIVLETIKKLKSIQKFKF